MDSVLKAARARWIDDPYDLFGKITGGQLRYPIYRDTSPIGSRAVLGWPIEQAVAEKGSAGRTGRADIYLEGIELVGPPWACQAFGVPSIELLVRLVVLTAAKQPPEAAVTKNHRINCRHARKNLPAATPNGRRIDCFPKAQGPTLPGFRTTKDARAMAEQIWIGSVGGGVERLGRARQNPAVRIQLEPRNSTSTGRIIKLLA